MVLITKQNLVNLNHQNKRFIVKITKSKYLDQDAGDGLRPNHYHCIENHQSAAWFGYILREIDNQVFLGVDWLEHLWAECNRRICLGARACGLAEFMFSDRYHLTFSASATVCPLMTGLMLWITIFSYWRTSLLLLLLNVFLKVRAMYFKADATISGASQSSACLSGAPPTCTSSTMNFLGVEGPFLDEVGSSRVVWSNCCLEGYIGGFSQLPKCFSKLLAGLMALPKLGHLSFLMGGSQWCSWLQFRWRRIWYVSCICVGFYILNTPSIAQSVASPRQSLQTWIRVEYQLKCYCNPLLLTWTKKKKIRILSRLIARANIEIYRHAQLGKKRKKLVFVKL